jgi:hypothetical protein
MTNAPMPALSVPEQLSTLGNSLPDDAMHRLAPAGAYIVVDRNERLVSTGLIYLGVIGDPVMIRRWLPNPERAEPFSIGRLWNRLSARMRCNRASYDARVQDSAARPPTLARRDVRGF